MKILTIADEESSGLWDYYRPGMLKDYDLILSAGDLKSEYLSFLVTMAHCPLLYVHGNHDLNYDRQPPEGCECIDDRLVTVNGIRILGLGGSQRYSGGPFQYTEREMALRIFRLGLKIRRAGGVDLVLAHAPVAGYGDMDDPAHRGFDAFKPLLDKYHPAYFIHGHIHQRYTSGKFPRELPYSDTTLLINCCGRYDLIL